jgi:hypothetical protein
VDAGVEYSDLQVEKTEEQVTAEGEVNYYMDFNGNLVLIGSW